MRSADMSTQVKIEFHDDFFLERGQVFVWGDITATLAYRVIRRLLYLNETLPSDKCVNMIIHSDGGDTDAAAAIIDTMLSLRSRKVATLCLGKAYSSASFILAMGTKGLRHATKHSSIMLHPVSVELSSDYITQQQRFTDFAKRQTDELSALVAKRCGKSRKIKQFTEDLDNGLWLTPTAAKKYGVIDKIIE